MKLISRTDLGWPPTAAAYWPTAQGVKVHYEGTPVHITDHSQCMSHWTALRNSHLANTQEGYVDIAYNFAVCLHGYVLEGRGIKHETAANGNQTLNKAHYSVVAFLGDDGDTVPTNEMLNGLRDAIEYMQANGAGSEIKGHRDGYPTSCPGDNLYAWVTAGAPRPTPPKIEDDMPIIVIGSVEDKPAVIPLPPLNSPLGLTQRWLSFASDFGKGKLRYAVWNNGAWRVGSLEVPDTGGRFNIDLAVGDEKVSVRRDTGDAGGPIGWMIEAK